MIRDKNLFGLLLISLLVKILYLVFAVIIQTTDTPLSFKRYTEITQRNDSGWFKIIAENGYPRITDKKDLGYSNKAEFRQSAWAFFPLYPLMNASLMTIPGFDFSLSGFILSILFSSLAFIGFYWFCENYLRDKKKAFFSTLVLMLFPFHYYFSMMYTEAVFLFLLVFAFLAILWGKYEYLPILIFPLALVRPNGIIAIIPLYFYFLEENGVVSKSHFSFKLLFSRKIILQSLLFLAGPLAFVLYGLYQEYMTGYFFAFSIAQAGWYREFMLPFLAFFRRGDFTTQFNSVYTILCIILAVFYWKKLPLSLNILVWVSLLLPLFSGSVTSMPRFISVIFPFTIIISGWIYNLKAKYAILVIFFCLQLWVFYYWLVGNSFSC
jgi:hypothetical protein